MRASSPMDVEAESDDECVDFSLYNYDDLKDLDAIMEEEYDKDDSDSDDSDDAEPSTSHGWNEVLPFVAKVRTLILF